MPASAQHEFIRPMLATLTDRRDLPGPRGTWLFERKLDGIRALAFRKGAALRLMSRNQNDLGALYPEVLEALASQPLDDFIIDGEIVALAGKQTSFQHLQQRLKSMSLAQARRSRIRIAYFVFDLLKVNGQDVRRLALRDRKQLLKEAIDFDRTIRITPHKTGQALALLGEACRQGWEGLIAKRADSAYICGRAREWYKLKCSNRQEFVVGGYTDPSGSRIVLGALLVGYYEGEPPTLRYAGKVGTGFSTSTLQQLGRQLGALASPTNPFAPDPALPRKAVHWIKPRLVADVVFAEWTRDGKLRHPKFVGLRADKPPRKVVRERAVPPR